MDLFAGVPVSDFAASLGWYRTLLGAEPSFYPHDTEAVWQVVEHGSLYIVQLPEHAGHARAMLFVDDLDERVARLTEQGLEPALREAFGDVRKISYRDRDGNEVAFGGR